MDKANDRRIRGGLAGVAGWCTCLLTLGARIQWGFAEELLGGCILPWLGASSIILVWLARAPLDHGTPWKFAAFTGLSTAGAYAIGGYPDYFEQGAYNNFGYFLALAALVVPSIVGGAISAGAMLRLARVALSTSQEDVFTAAASTHLFAYGLLETFLTLMVNRGYAIRHWAAGAVAVSREPMDGTIPLLFVALATCVGGMVSAASARTK